MQLPNKGIFTSKFKPIIFFKEKHNFLLFTTKWSFVEKIVVGAVDTVAVVV